MPWATIFALLQMVWSAASPALKQVAIDELKKLEADESGKPVLAFLIAEAEKFVAAA